MSSSETGRQGRMGLAGIWLLALAGTAPGETATVTPLSECHAQLAIVRADPLVRPPLLWRVLVRATCSDADADRSGYTLTSTLATSSQILAADHLELERLGQLREAAAIVLAPQVDVHRLGPEPATLRVVLASADGRDVEVVERRIPTVGTLTARLAALGETLRRRAEPDPLPWLWLEQGQEIAYAGNSGERCGLLQALLGRLGAAAAGRIPPEPGERAWRDPVDGSVQYERVHPAPPGPDGAPAREAWVLVEPARALAKSDWPPLPRLWLAAAAAAGTTVVECYAAGDAAWSGIARWRADRRLAAHRGPVALIGVGAGADAAVWLARRHPGQVGVVRVVTPRQLLEDPRIGLPVEAAPGAANALPTGADLATAQGWLVPDPPPPATLPPPPPDGLDGLTAYARGPFVVVVGMGEHRAAQSDDLALATAFRTAWARHAHGLPPLVTDDTFDRRRWRDATWILIGNPRSNRIAATLDPASWPVQWDGRSVALGAQRVLRCERRPVAVLTTHDNHRLAILLDGAFTFPDGGLPLAGVTAPWLGPPPTLPTPGADPELPATGEPTAAGRGGAEGASPMMPSP